MNKFLLLLLCCFFFKLATGQNAAHLNVKGSVIDSATNNPVAFATVAITDAGTNQPVKSTLTKDNGSFQIINLPVKAYKATIIFVGYRSKTIAIRTNSDGNLGRILLTSSSKQLKEVAVSAARPLIKQEIDRIAYDIQADPENKVLNVLDMMRKVPLLSLDADDNIKLNGGSDYKIFINGKPSSMLARNPSDVLKSMPASSIQKIEVITNPPAKYDAEGLAGIINIITNKKVDNGYNGSININDRFPIGGPGAGGSLTVKENKLGFSSYFGTNKFSQPVTHGSSSRITTGDDPTDLEQTTSRKSGSQYSYVGGELSYEIDTLNLITGEFSFNGGHSNSNSDQFSNLIAKIPQIYNLSSANKYANHGYDLGLNYQLGFKRNKEQLLTFSYKYSVWNSSQLNDIDIYNRTNFHTPNYQQNNKDQSGEQTVQVDYVHPTKKVNIEGGVKAIIRNNNSNYQHLTQDSITAEYNPDPTQSNVYHNYQYIIGAYNSYTYNLKTWSFKGGARLEETIIDADFISSNSQVKPHYFNLIPNIAIGKKFKDMSSLNFGYTQRISRPSIWNLNPFIDKSNPNFWSTGNPGLQPVVTNNFQLNYSKFKKGSVNIGINYNFANNTIQQLSTYDSTTKVTLTNYGNVGHTHSLGSNFNINYPIVKNLNFSLNGNLNYLWLQGMVNGKETSNKGTQGYFSTFMSYKFNNGLRLNANFNFSSPYLTLQGSSSSYIYSSVSANKEIIKDKLTVAVFCGNPFNKYRNYTSKTVGSNFVQESFSQNYYRAFAASINYRFGKLKSDIKKNKRSINNDDKTSSGSSSN